MIKHDVVRNNLIKQAWKLFLNQGYEKCTLALLLKELNISKGEFYHYFSSKEECAKACAEFYATQCVEKMKSEISPDASPLDKLKVFLHVGQELSEDKEINKVNTAPNLVFHQILMSQMIKKVALLYRDIFVQGNEMGLWSIPMPLESAEAFLVLTNYYLDDVIFEWNTEQFAQKMKFCFSYLAQLLNMNQEKLQKILC